MEIKNTKNTNNKPLLIQALKQLREYMHKKQERYICNAIGKLQNKQCSADIYDSIYKTINHALGETKTIYCFVLEKALFNIPDLTNKRRVNLRLAVIDVWINVLLNDCDFTSEDLKVLLQSIAKDKASFFSFIRYRQDENTKNNFLDYCKRQGFSIPLANTCINSLGGFTKLKANYPKVVNEGIENNPNMLKYNHDMEKILQHWKCEFYNMAVEGYEMSNTKSFHDLVNMLVDMYDCYVYENFRLDYKGWANIA